MAQLGVERALDHGLGQLLEQTGGAQNVLGPAVVLEQLVQELSHLGVILDGHGCGHCCVSPLGYGAEQ